MGDHDTLDILADPLAQLRVRPNPDDQRLTVNLAGIDHTGAAVETRVPVERSLTLFLNGQEIVTAMTIGDYPEDLAVGYFLNQGMLRPDDMITGIDYDEELSVVVVRTARKTNYEEKLAQEDPDLRLRAGHRFRRPDGRDRRHRDCRPANCARPGCIG